MFNSGSVATKGPGLAFVGTLLNIGTFGMHVPRQNNAEKKNKFFMVVNYTWELYGFQMCH